MRMDGFSTQVSSTDRALIDQSVYIGYEKYIHNAHSYPHPYNVPKMARWSSQHELMTRSVSVAPAPYGP